jgi:hypothetical protein
MTIPSWLANFSGYWKEVSVILTGLFAVLGLAGEYKDKDTGKLTVWGRTFLVLTIVSMGFGLIAQIQDNKDSDRLLTQTQNAVHQLTRIIQAFDAPAISIALEMNCTSGKFKPYCDRHLHDKKSRDEVYRASGGIDPTYSVDDLPGGPNVLLPLHVYFFKEKRDFDDFVKGRDFILAGKGDASIDLLLNNYAKEPNLEVYGMPERGFEIHGYVSRASIKLKDQKIISIADLPGSIMVITEGNKMLNDLTPMWFSLTTPRGQEIVVDQFTPQMIGGSRIFTHAFPPAPVNEE